VVLVTHGHPDHLPLAERFARQFQATVQRYPELGDDDIVRAGTLNLTALYTPGHSADHLCFLIAEDRAIFTGDLVLGQGSSMVTYPEGDVAAYLRSLDRLAALQPRILFPGHWDPVTEAAAKIAEYKKHRLEREAQIVAEVRRGGGTAAELTRRVYGELDDKLMVAAALIVLAELGRVYGIVALIIIGREITVSALREWMAQIGQSKSVAVNILGKVKTVTQLVAIPFLLYNGVLFGLFNTGPVGRVLIWVAAAVTLFSMVVYLKAAWDSRQRANP